MSHRRARSAATASAASSNALRSASVATVRATVGPAAAMARRITATASGGTHRPQVTATSRAKARGTGPTSYKASTVARTVTVVAPSRASRIGRFTAVATSSQPAPSSAQLAKPTTLYPRQVTPTRSSASAAAASSPADSRPRRPLLIMMGTVSTARTASPSHTAIETNGQR